MTIEKPWMHSGTAMVKHFGVKDPLRGLTDNQVEEHREKYGQNTIPSSEGTSIFVLILKQFEDMLVLILLGAAVISFILALTEDSENRLTAFVEPAVILIILICNATVGVLQESKAESAIEKLKETEASHAVVIRNGKSIEIDAIDLVPGDIIVVAEGEKIPADCRILTIKTNTLLVEEPALTGESEPSIKSTEVLKGEQIANGDKKNLLFSGSLCVKGRCTAIVAFTGLQTELGKIASDLDKKKKIGDDDNDDDSDKTPLQRKLDEFGEQLSKVISVICLLVWLININHFNDPIHGGSWFKGAIYYFKIAVALAVAAIPEGLPAVVTTCLAIGAQKMASHGAIVRNLPSVETLGCTTVICSDKTGTLTTNMQSAQLVAVVTGNSSSSSSSSSKSAAISSNIQQYTVFGDSWSPFGQVVDKDEDDNEILFPSIDVPSLQKIAMISSLCNEATLTATIQIDELSGQEKLIPTKTGAATEAALLVLAEKLGTPLDDQHRVAKQILKADGNDIDQPQNVSIIDTIRESLPLADQMNYVRSYYNSRYTIVHTLEFTRDRKSMSVLCQSVRDNGQDQNEEDEEEEEEEEIKPSKKGASTKKSIKSTDGDKLMLLCKGAAEKVLERCTRVEQDGEIITITPKLRKNLVQQLETMNSDGLRSLALAYNDNPPSFNGSEGKIYQNDENYIKIEQDMILVGFVGILDPPRASVPEAIQKCREAGIRVIMITGDNQHTAEAIAERINLYTKEYYIKNNLRVSYSGNEVENMSEIELQDVVSHARIFSRVEHHHKLRIVEALQKNGEIVAMGGDGVNDATALKTADIGIAMGSGTSVAKEASKMVLQNDDFSTIVLAVEQGRTIYANTKQFIRYLISSNIGEVACIFGTSILGLPDALLPVQLLWVNLVTDGLPATALGLNPPDKDVMTQRPRNTTEPIIDLWLFIRYVVIGIYVGIGTILGYIWWFLYSTRGPQTTFWALTHFHQCGTSTEPVFLQMIDMAKNGLIDGVSIIANDSTTQEEICEKVFENYLPSTMSLSILVTIEMFNAMNAVSENQSIFIVSPFSNIYVILATILSFILHFIILYIPWFADIFHVLPLNFDEWKIVIYASLPVFLLDEGLKAISRFKRGSTSGMANQDEVIIYKRKQD